MLREFIDSTENEEGVKQKELLWIYVPDYDHKGEMNTIKSVPVASEFINETDYSGYEQYWSQTEECAGF